MCVKPHAKTLQFCGLQCLALSCFSCYHVGMSKIYFGGSRNFNPSEQSIAVLRAVILSGCSVHVGCQSGADQSVVSYVGFFAPSSLSVFAVAPSKAQAPRHIQQIPISAHIVYSAGGDSAPMPARYLLRSIAAFQGCSQAVFFSPGNGSIAVARECVRAGLPVFAFGDQPAPVPSVSGQWVASSFMGFECWQWSAPDQPKLFQ